MLLSSESFMSVGKTMEQNPKRKVKIIKAESVDSRDISHEKLKEIVKNENEN
jgi:hypothetical protein